MDVASNSRRGSSPLRSYSCAQVVYNQTDRGVIMKEELGCSILRWAVRSIPALKQVGCRAEHLNAVPSEDFMRAEFVPEKGVILTFEQNLNDMAIAVHAMLAINRCTKTLLLSEIISMIAAVSHESKCTLCGSKITQEEHFTFYKEGIRHMDCKGSILPFTGMRKEA